MQFFLHLKRLGGNGLLPQNYQQDLSWFIDKILRHADADCSHFFQMEGFRSESKRVKPFTFSALQFDRFMLHPKLNSVHHSGNQAILDIRFAVDRAAEGYIRGLFLNQKIELRDDFCQVDYQISAIEEVPPVYFHEEMYFRSLSPIFLHAVRQDGGSDYLSPYDERYSGVFKTNLLRRFLSFYPEIAGLQELESYCPEIRFELTTVPQKKVFNLKNQSGNPIKANGYQFDFKLKASPILQELGYYGGFGSKNEMGFGCVGVVGD